MIRLLRVWSVASAIALIAVPAAWAAQEENAAADPQGIQRLKAATGGRAEVSIRRGTGAVQFVRLGEGKGEASLAPPSARGASATEQAKAFFAEYGSIFGIQNVHAELEARGERTDKLGYKHATFQQVHNGVPVFGAELKGHLDAEGRLVAVNGTGVPGITVDTTPRRSAAEAGLVALKSVTDGTQKSDTDGADTSSPKGVVVKNTRLVVYRTGLLQGVEGRDHLTYEVEVGNGADVREFVFVDAHTGKKVDQITGIQDGLFRRAYDGLNLPTVPPSYPASPFWVEGDSLPTTSVEADNMIYASKETYDTYFNAFGYDSFDAAGATMDAIFNRGYGCPNASWNGTFISFCPGFTTDDVTAHEWSHAYTQYTDNLIYAWQSGALNEAYSDIFGETVDLINARGVDSPGGPRTGLCSVYTRTAQLTVNTPPAIAGVKPAQAAGFGPQLVAPGVTGDVVIATDDANPAGPATNDACTVITNPGVVAGNIALVVRGTCNFSVKVKNAQDAGAVAVIIYNNVASGLPGMGAGLLADQVTIPSLGISQANGNAITANLPVNATLGPLPTPTDDSYRWLMGEEVNPGGALRDMSNPNCYSNPAKVSDVAYYVCSTTDNGGVHSNSGVPNKMFSLLVDGGFYNNQNVLGIGLTKAAHVYFRAKFYHVSSTDFPEHADAMEQACNDLRGQPLASLTGVPGSQFITASDCAQVTKAIAAVELRTPPTQCNFQPQLAKNPPANVCVVGPANLLYSENVEGSIAPWTRTHQGVFAEFTPRDWVQTSALPGDRAGSAFFALDDPNLGDCTPGSHDESGVLYLDSPAIVVPATPGFPRLVFDHYVATEGGWDGGNLKISVNGGVWQNVSFTKFVYNAYTFLLNPATSPFFNTNPLAGEEAWTGADGGSNRGSWGKSILDLSGLAQPGDSVRVRFALGNDGCGGNDGWYVDDISMYQCTQGTAATLSINDVTVTEGNTGSQNATFTLTLSEASSAFVTVRVSTADNTAVAPGDYTAVSNLLVTFAPGVTTRTVNVAVKGDIAIEANETFFVNLTNPTNATTTDAQGVGTIIDNDGPPPVIPTVSIDDVTLAEGHSGTTNATFTLTLSQSTTNTVTVQVDTADDTATAPSDYTAVSALIVTFNPGDTTKTVDVPVVGDLMVEGDETFFVNLSAPVNATIADGQGVGTITNDDHARSDFNADEKTDILWWSPMTGNLNVWFMDGVNRTSGANTTPMGYADTANQKAVAVADFDGDGKPDILWRNTSTLKLLVWFMNGTTRTSGAFMTPDGLALPWQVISAADFNNDGKADLLWWNSSTGQLAIWHFNGLNRISAVSTTPGGYAPSQYQPVGVGFFNADTSPDIVWRNPSTGQLLVWLMNGATRVSGSFTTPAGYAPSMYTLEALGDFNADGKTDIVWKNPMTGQLLVWLMDGVNRTSGQFATPNGYTDRVIVSPK